MTTALPQSLLDLLAHPPPHGGPYSPRVIYRPDDGPGRIIHGMNYPAVRALVDDGVIRNDWVGAGAGIALTGHDQRALDDFRVDVYAAWDRFQARTKVWEMA